MKWLAVLLLALLLGGCSPAFGTMPAYIVLLTPPYPVLNRCTGAALDSTHVLTAAHCVEEMTRGVTAYGQEVRVIAALSWPVYDVALLTVQPEMAIYQFAQLGSPVPTLPAKVWGNCPYYFSHVPRMAWYSGVESVEFANGATHTYDGWWTAPRTGDGNKVCGGDSGGVLTQGGTVVGMTSAVLQDTYFVKIGRHFYTVNGVTVAGLVGQ